MSRRREITRLFYTQSGHWIDSRGAAGCDVAGKQTEAADDENGDAKGEPVCGSFKMKRDSTEMEG